MSHAIKVLLRVLVVGALNLVIIACLMMIGQVNTNTWSQQEQVAVVASSLRKGSTGDSVKEMQQKLKNWGYYSGAVDGIYGSGTMEAVKDFQRKSGLRVDGIAGPVTLSSMGISSNNLSATTNGVGSYSQADIDLLARIISAEARGEPYTGQVAVGAVVLNRVKHPSFPDTVSGVIYQPKAFTAVVDGQFEKPVEESAQRAAADALTGWDPSGGAVFYFNPDKTDDEFMHSRPVITIIGDHNFCS